MLLTGFTMNFMCGPNKLRDDHPRLISARRTRIVTSRKKSADKRTLLRSKRTLFFLSFFFFFVSELPVCFIQKSDYASLPTLETLWNFSFSFHCYFTTQLQFEKYLVSFLNLKNLNIRYTHVYIYH